MPHIFAAVSGNSALLEVRATDLPEVLELRPRRLLDERGFFSETWNATRMREVGLDVDFVQDNHSQSARGVLRGLHYQAAPHAQAKLVRVSRGAAFDVAVDLRRASPTFGRWIGLTLSADNWNQLFIPAGFAHGFVALEAETEVQYKTSAFYSSEHDRAIRFDDPAIGIDWPFPTEELLISERDRLAPLLPDAELFP